jgi:hypothetical protein
LLNPQSENSAPFTSPTQIVTARNHIERFANQKGRRTSNLVHLRFFHLITVAFGVGLNLQLSAHYVVFAMSIIGAMHEHGPGAVPEGDPGNHLRLSLQD